MQAGSGLETGLLVGGEDEVVVAERDALPRAVVQVEDAASPVGKIGVAGEDPATVLPSADGVLVEPAPDGAAADRGDEAAGAGFAPEVAHAPAGEGKAAVDGELAGEGTHLDDDLRAGKPGGDRGVGVPQDRPSGMQRSACAKG